MLQHFKKPSVLGFIIALFCAIFALWFYLTQLENENYIVLDNPLDELINVHIDKQNYTVGPYQTIRINLPAKKHRIKSFINDSMVAQGSFSNKNAVRGLINPMLQNYVIYTRYYGKAVNRDSLLKAHETSIDDQTYYGELYETDSLFIKDFYLNVDQQYPKVIKSMDTISGIPKIFRKENFKKYYRQYIE